MKKALILSCFDWWYEKRIEPIAEILSSEYQIMILVSDYNHLNKAEIEKKISACTYIHVLPYKKNISMKRILSHLQFGKTVKRYLKDYEPDLIYLLLPPNNTAYYCLKYKKKHKNIKYIVDIIDMWPESMPIGRIKDTLACKLWRNLRNSSIEMADLVITECDLYRKKLGDLLKEKKVVTNYIFKNQDVKLLSQAVKKEKKYNNNSISIGYVGSINSILDINKIEKLLSNMKKAGINITCKVIGDGDHKDDFIEMLKSVAVVEYYGKIYDEEKKYRLLSTCDYGLNIMKPTVTVGLTIKSLDYFSFGLPIINNIQGDTWRLVEKMHLGINIDDDLERVVQRIKTERMDSRNIIKCFEENFTREAYIRNVKSALAMIGVEHG